MKKLTKHNQVYIYISLALIGLLMLTLWPSLVAAMPLTAKNQLERAWRFAGDIGSYNYNSTVIQTDHPIADLRNAGRSSTAGNTPNAKQVSVQGTVDLPHKSMSMKLWTVDIDQDGVEIKIENGKAYGRMNAEGGWVEISDPSQVFAPGGDPLGFLLAAENIQELEIGSQEAGESDPTLDEVIANPQVLTSTPSKRYAFDINGVKYAEYVRRQLEAGMREQGELPPNVTLGVLGHYVDMTGRGEVWLDEDGLPVRQVIHMAFPPERGALHRTENTITTSFSNWNTPAVHHQLFWAIPRLVDDPTILTKDPLSLLPTPYALLSKFQALTPENLQNVGILLGISLLATALVVMAITHRKSPKFYAGLSTAVITLMLITPLINANQAHAFAGRQQARVEAQQEQLATQQKIEAEQAETAGRNFNPLVNPLAGPPPNPRPLGGGVTASPPLGGTEGGLFLPQQQTTCTLAPDGDCDGDGLTDDVELYELGTNPEKVDSDGDRISDKAEVEGFSQNGTHWYLDPVNPDSNGDGTLDGAACPTLVDVVNDALANPSGSQCLNSDSDRVPDIFDFDDDGDGVPDLADSSPLDVTGPFNATDNQLDFNLKLNQNGKPVYVNFEIRPTNPDHLHYTRNILDWPNDDTRGQWTKNSDTNYADLENFDSGDGDMMLIPLLEFEITYDAGNPTAGLPITNSVSIGSITDYNDLSWVDTDELGKWGISVQEGETANTMLLWVPLNIVKDEVGDTPIAWNGRMAYLPQTVQTKLGRNQKIRLVWVIEGILDTCTPPTDSDYDTYCAKAANWEGRLQIMQTYYDDFTLTGLTVREDHGGKVQIIAEPATVGNPNYDDYLWHLADGLQDTYLRGRQKPGGGRFTADDIPTFAATWGVSGLNYTTKTLNDQSDLATIAGEDNLTILNNVHSGATAGDKATLLLAGEEVARNALLSDDATTVSGSSVSVDLTQVDQATNAILRLNPFVYKGANVWEQMDLGDYENALAANLQAVFTNTQLDALVAPNSETISDYGLARDGAISLAQGYFLALYIGLNGIAELNAAPVNSDAFTNAGYTRSEEVATGLTRHMLAQMQAYYAEKSVITALAAGSSTNVAANALSATFAESQSAILAALGAARQGDTSSGLSLTLQELRNYYKTVDVDASNFADPASISAQYYVSTATYLTNRYGQGWSAAYTSVKIATSLYNLRWGLQILKGTAPVVAENAKLIVKLWNSTKFWAVAGFLTATAIALISFLTGDYDNQLAYNAAAVKFAFTIIVAAVLAVISAIPVVGYLITGIIAAIDALMALICSAVDVEAGSSFDTWFCNGLTGILIRGLSLLFSDQLILVDLDKDDRLEVTFNTPTVVKLGDNDGFLQSNQIAVNATVTNTISLNKPTVGENLVILNAFDTDELKDRMRKSTFAYYLQDSQIDHHKDLEWGDTGRWFDNGDKMRFDISGNGAFRRAGINQPTSLYLTESYNVVGLDCTGFIWAYADWSCREYPIRGSLHNFVGQDFAFDIVPATLDEFYSLAPTGRGGYRLAWDERFPTLPDADGDGVPHSLDPNDNQADTDTDGLTDLWELDNGFDAALVDGDGDGLTDYWEAFYGANPRLADTDNDGLPDGDEFFHSKSRNAYVADDTVWAGGWLFTYAFNGNTPLQTRVSANPIDADTDDDNVTDRLEYVYGYHPRVPQELNILSLNANAEPIVAPNATIPFTATIKNELDNRTARGLLEAEYPVDTNQGIQTFVLSRLEETTLNGSVTAPNVAQTTETSVTIRAGAFIEDPDPANTPANVVAQYQFNENQPDTPCPRGTPSSPYCSSGNYQFADSSGHGHNALCRKDLNNFNNTTSVWGLDCPVANGSYLDFVGLLHNSNDLQHQFFWTPVAYIEPHNDFNLESFSIEAWARPSENWVPQQQNIVSKYGDFTLGIKRLSLTPFIEVRKDDCSNKDGGSKTTLYSSHDLIQSAWNQLVVTYNKDTDVLTIYVNGQSSGSIITSSCMNSGLNERITIGAMDRTFDNNNQLSQWTPPPGTILYGGDVYQVVGYSSYTYYGDLDRLQFFDGTLTVDEIGDLYNKGNRTLELKFDDPPGSATFADTSGNQFDGTCLSYCPDSGRPGLDGQTIYFDYQYDNVFIPASGEALGLSEDLDQGNNFTIMAWLKGGNYNLYDRQVLIEPIIGLTRGGYPFLGNYLSNGTLVAPTPLDANDWHHVAWRLEYGEDQFDATRTIFVDGVQVAQDIGFAFGVTDDKTRVGLYYNGWVDDLVVARNALSQAEIQAYMKSSPLLSLHLDEDLDTTSFVDEAPGRNPATCSGSRCPQAGADGWMREAPVFDGNDELTVAATNELNVTDFSLGMWVKPIKKKGAAQWLIRKDNSSGYERNYALNVEPDSMTVRFSGQSGCYNSNAGWKYFNSQGQLLENQWNHIMATYDNDANQMVLYLNGALDTVHTVSYTGVCSNSQPITIGENFEGSLDEVNVYGGRLTPLEVAQIYAYQSAWYDTVQQVPVIIDPFPPEITLGTFTNIKLEPTMIGAFVVDDDSMLSNVAGVNVTITPPAGGGSYTEPASGSGNGDWMYYFSPSVEGEYAVEFTATDLAGNVSAATTIINVDGTPPSAQIDAGLTSALLSTSPPITDGANTLSVSGTISDGGNPASGLVTNSVTIDMRDWQDVSVSGSQPADATTTAWQVDYPFVGPAYGRYDVVANAADVAGNVVTDTIGTIAVDDLGPTADVMMGTIVISSAHSTLLGTVMDVPYPGNSRQLHLHFEEAAPPFADATLRQARATCDGSACPAGGQSGQLGRAADFDGTDVLTTVNILDPAETSFTALAWFNLDSASGNRTILSQQDGDGVGRTWLGVNAAGQLYSDLGGSSLSGPATVNSGGWHHAAVSYDGDMLRLYLDGTLAISATRTMEASSGQMVIGADKNGGGHFNGRLDELALYDRAFDVDEIYDIANPLPTGIDSAQIRLRHFNGNPWPAVNSDGFMMYMPLDEAGDAAEFEKSSPYPYTVTCDGTCNHSQNSHQGQAIYFNGTNNLEVSNEEFFDFENEVSVSAWIKSNGSDNNFGPLYAVIAGKELSWSLLQYGDTGRMYFLTSHPSGGFTLDNHQLVGSANLADGEWHHVVATYDGVTKSLYVDGVLDVSDAVADTVNPLLAQSDRPVWIGDNSLASNNQRNYKGYLDEVTIFGRGLTPAEVQSLNNEPIWHDVSLASTNANFTTWQYTLPDTTEGPYDIDLRATDALGNSNTQPNSWIGNIDVIGPRATLTYTQIYSDQYRTRCYAEDLNMSKQGWDCPAAGEPTAELQDIDWFVDFFSPLTGTKAYRSQEEDIIGGSTASMTACDLVNNCTTLMVSPTLLSEVNLILTPTHTSVFTGLNPIEVGGTSRSHNNIQSLEVWANGDSIYSTTWPTGTTESLWSFDWTPPGGGVYTLTTTMLNGLNQPVTDPNPKVITVVGPYLTLTKLVTPTGVLAQNDPITYTLVLSNSGNFTATNIVITDVLPVNAVGDDLTESISLLAPGSAVSYTIAATITNFISDEVINTAYFTETQQSGQATAISRQCGPEFEVTNASDEDSPGSLRYAVNHACDGALITFSADFTIPLQSALQIRTGMTIDATGHDITLDGQLSDSGLLSVSGQTNPVTLKDLNLVNGGSEGSVFNFGGPGPVTILDSTFDNNFGADFNNGVLTNNTDLTLIGSTFTNNRSPVSVISNHAGRTLTILNSTFSNHEDIYVLILNDAGGEVTINHSTLVDYLSPFGGGLDNSGQMTIANSIVVGNGSTDCFGAITDGGYNLFADGAGCPTDSGTTQTISPTTTLFETVLGPLDSYGGDTPSYALQVGSPAIDTIPPGSNGCGATITTDQRGLSRPMLAGCDTGAFEAQGYVLTVTGGLSQSTYLNTTFADPLEVTVTNPYSEPVGSGDIIFTAPAAGASLTNQTITASLSGGDVASATVTANGITGSYTVTATAKGIDNTASFSLTNVAPPVDLAITKTVDPVAALVGQPVTYTLAFSNVGAYTATNVIITDIVPEEVSSVTYQVSSDAGVTITRTANVSYAWTVSDLGPGQGGVITIGGQVSSALSNGTAFTNTAEITSAVDITPTNNSAAVGLEINNVAPVVGPIPTQTISETIPFTFTIPAADPNGETNLTFGLVDGAVGDAAIDNSSGLFSWTPGELAGPGTFTFTVMVTDSGSLTDTADFVVNVTEVNTAPVLAAIPNQSITETFELTFSVQATDGDVPAQTLSYGLGGDAPAGATISNDGLVSWTPAESEGGSVVNFTILVTDTSNLSDSQPVQVTVTKVNAAPVITAGNTVSVTMTEDSTPTPFDLTLYATDSDLPSDTLTWSLSSGPANGVALAGGTDLSQTVTYTPTADFNGFDSFTVAVSDGTLTDTIEVSVTVTAVNDPPSFVSLGSQTTAPLTNTQQGVTGWASGFDFGPADEDAAQSVQDFLVQVTNGTRLFSRYPSVSNDGTLTYTPNGTSGMAEVTVWLQDDGGIENGGLNQSNPVTFTITIPRETEYSVIASTDAISEMDSGSQAISFTVSRSGDTGVTGQVDYSLGGTASYGSDYGNIGGSSDTTGLSGTLSFGPGEVSQTITLDIFGDLVDESITYGDVLTSGITTDYETIELQLFNGGNTSVANVVVQDDDTAGVTIVESSGSSSVAEAGPSSDTYTLQLTSVPTESVTITVAPDSQLDVGSGAGQPITLMFAADLTALTPQTVTITAVDDQLVEGAHTGLITHGVSSGDLNYTGTTSINPNPVLTVAIDDNDDVDVRLMKEVTPTTALPGQTITYTLTFSNAGNDPAYGVEISDAIPPEVDVLGVTNSGVTITQTPGLTYAWTIGDLAPGQGGVITIRGEVNPSLTAGSFTNVATITTTAVESDTTNNSDQASVTVSNAAPALALLSDQTITETETLTFTATATDTDQALTYGLSDAPAGATIGSSSGEFTWTTTEADGPSVYSATIVVSDGMLTDSQTIEITVTEVNEAPVLATIPDQTILQGETISFTATATDSDVPTQTLTYSLSDAPVDAAIDSSSGAFSWLTTTAGVYSATVVVSDGVLTDNQTIALNVTAVNSAPELTTLSDQTVDEGETVSFTATATDSDVPTQTLTYSLSDAPISATLDSTGVFTWLTTEADGPGVYSATIVVSDGILTDSQIIEITVNEINEAPVLTAIPDQTVLQGETVSFTAMATDTDVPTQTLTFSLSDAPAAASIDRSSGAFTWTTAESDTLGVYGATISVSDGVLTDSQTINITLNDDNTAPVLDPIAPQAIIETLALTFTAVATDAENDPLTFGLYNTSSGMSIDPDSGEFSWTPTEAQGMGATYFFSIIVSDTSGLTDTTVVMITVNELNEAPVLAAIGDQTLAETQLFSLTLEATDSDLPANTLSYTMINGPAGANLAEASGLFSWTPDANQGPGEYTVTFIVSDDGSPALTDSETITLSVTDSPGVVITESGGSTEVDEDGTITAGYHVVLNTQPGEDVTITITNDGQVETSQTSLIFTPANWGEAQSVLVSAVDDAVYEGPHTGQITHAVSSLDPNYDGFSIASVVANISDNDPLPSLDIGSITIDEVVGTATVAVTLTGQSIFPAGVSYTIADGTASGSGVDYSASDGTLNWAASTSGSQTIEVTIIDDTLDEPDETVNLSLSTAVSATISTGNGLLTITDNDEASALSIVKTVTVSNPAAVQPGEAISYTIVVANSGGEAIGVVVSDTLPAYINGTNLNQTVDISANDSVTFTILATVANDVPAGLTITNTAGFSHATGSGQAMTAITIDETVTPTKPVIYVSSDSNGSVNGLLFADEDILAYDPNTNTWRKYFDGSDVGLNGTDLNAFFLLDDGSILLSLDRRKSLPGLGQVDGSDIVRFVPASLGETTVGSFEWYFDGSDVGLTRVTENVDTIAFTPEGDLLLSTIGPFAVPGVGGRDEDLIRFTASHLGQNTRGTWSRYFDGSDIGLRRNSEDLRSAWIDPANNDIYLTTKGNFSVDGISGDGSDIFICTPGSLGATTSCTFSFYWDGSAHGLAENVDAFAFGNQVTVNGAGANIPGLALAEVELGDIPEEENIGADDAGDENDGDEIHALDDISTGAEEEDTPTIYLPSIFKNEASTENPDVVVESLTLTPIADNTYTVTIVARNQGEAVTYGNNFFINAYLSSNLNSPIIVCSVQATDIGAGQSVSCSGRYTFSNGVDALRGWVDPYNHVVEADEINNIKEAGVVVLGNQSLSISGNTTWPEGPLPTPTPALQSR